MHDARHQQRSGGFTIFEVMIVVAIFGLLVGASVLTFRNITRSDLRSAASRTAAAMRFAFDRATMTGAYIRLAIDLDKGEVWPEVSEKKVTLRAGKEQHVVGDKDAQGGEPVRKARKPPPLPLFAPTKEEKEGKAEDEGDAGMGGFDAKSLTAEWEADKAPAERPRARFQAIKGTGAKKIKLAKGISVSAVMTARLSEPVEKGTAYIYFFPQGHAEPAIVHFVDRSEDYYSIVLHPLTGQARIYPCQYKIPKDFDVSDDKRVRSGKDPCAARGGL